MKYGIIGAILSIALFVFTWWLTMDSPEGSVEAILFMGWLICFSVIGYSLGRLSE